MRTIILSVAQREIFNEIANRSLQAETVRSHFDADQWMSDHEETFIIPEEVHHQFVEMWVGM